MLSERGRQIVGKVRDYENIMIMGEGCGQGCGRIRNCSAQTKDAEGSENDARYWQFHDSFSGVSQYELSDTTTEILNDLLAMIEHVTCLL